MKKNLITLLFGLLFIIPIASKAQVKIGYVNSQEILLSIPGMTEANDELKKFGEELQKEQKAKIDLYQAKVAEYEANAATMTETIKKSRESDLLDLQKRIQESEASAPERYAKKEQLLMGPLYQKANEAIKAIAKEKGYTYVFDVANGTIVYVDEESKDNLSEAVKTELQKSMGTEETGATTTDK